jgi:hypothetical protein
MATLQIDLTAVRMDHVERACNRALRVGDHWQATKPAALESLPLLSCNPNYIFFSYLNPPSNVNSV